MPRKFLALSRRNLGPLLLSLGIFGSLVLVSHFGISVERGRQESKLRADVASDLLGIASRLEAELTADVYLANGLAALVTSVHRPTEDELQSALKSLYGLGRHLRNVGMAPGNRITHVYPTEGNQAAIGLYYPDLPDQWPAVQAAIEHRTTLLAGPVTLRQGGSGLISRTPVFTETGPYWGVLSLVIDADSLFKKAGLAPESDGLRYALRGKDSLGSEGSVFFGDPALFAADAALGTISVPGGSWQLAAMPIDGWRQGQEWLDRLEAMGLGIWAMIAILAFAYQQGRQRIADSERRLRIFMATTHDGVIVINDRGLIEEFNPAAETLFGYSAAEMLGTPLTRLMGNADAATHDGHVSRPAGAPRRTMSACRQVYGRRKDGSEFPIEVTVGEAEIENRRIHVGVLRDITERRAFEKKLMELATTDGLTGAANRRSIMQTLGDSFVLARRHHRSLSVLVIDADHFKNINDIYGHQAGDQVLVRLAAIANSCLRATDHFGRLGGEEFVAVLPDTDAEQALQVAERLREAMARETIILDDGRPVQFTVSIGAASLAATMPTPEILVSTADTALYAAKATGRNRVCGPAVTQH